MNTDEIVICTIFSKNYLSYVRTLADSFYKANPKGKMFALLVDTLDGSFNPKEEKFDLVSLEDISIENLESFCFKYSIVELNTAVKAHFLSYLFSKHNFKKIIYLDPDIFIVNSLENIWNLLDKKSILLTPHMLKHISDDKRPSESDLKKAGIFNLGFIALANNQDTEDFLEWWKEKLYNFCWMNPEEGFHVDQKWVENVPNLFKNVYVIKHPGYNVAYWNLMERDVRIDNGKLSVNEKPLYFFHFSGFVAENIEIVSKHQNRFKLNQLENLRPLFELYRDMIIENNYLQSKNFNCKFSYFENGIKIPDEARKIFNKTIKNSKNFSNPFSIKSKNSFFQFLNEVIDDKKPVITRLWYEIYKERKDLHEVFPYPLERDRDDFFNWLKNSLKKEFNLDDKFLPDFVVKEYDNFKKLNAKTKFDFSRDSQNLDALLGINVAGYFHGQFGVAESARLIVKSLKAANIPHVLNNIESEFHSNEDSTFDDFSSKNPYPINLIVVNADQSDVFFREFGPDYFKGRYNIALWAWELSKFPDKWLENLQYFNEIWTHSSFVSNSMKDFSIPVENVSCPISINDELPNRKKFGIKDSDFVFLFIFDFASIFERKNPLGLIKAFKSAFGDKGGIKLVIKSINGKKFPTEFKQLEQECKNNVIHFSEHFEKKDVDVLIASCNCYVSLHRAEGLGITIAEAMSAGKPVITTNYGGNTDFMNTDNSFPVKYSLKKLDKDYGDYKKGNVWAEPDLEDAITLMKQVYENKKLAAEIGDKAKKYIKEKMSFSTIGNNIFNHIKKLEIKKIQLK